MMVAAACVLTLLKQGPMIHWETMPDSELRVITIMMIRHALWTPSLRADPGLLRGPAGSVGTGPQAGRPVCSPGPAGAAAGGPAQPPGPALN